MQLIFFQGKLRRLKALKLVTSHTFLYKTLDKFGANHDEHLRDNKFTEAAPRKIVIDNFDFTTKVHYMTEMHQNSDEHWVSVSSTEDRVFDESLSSKPPSMDTIIETENCSFLPNVKEISEQRQNYISLCGRIACENLSCLKGFMDVSVKHIRHKYSALTCKKTDTVSLLFWHKHYFEFGEI